MLRSQIEEAKRMEMSSILISGTQFVHAYVVSFSSVLQQAELVGNLVLVHQNHAISAICDCDGHRGPKISHDL